MSFETIAITAVVGLFAGWLTGVVMKGGGYGLVGDTTLGVVGGVAGGLILRMQGIALAPAGGWFAMVAAAFVGAFILIVIQRKFWNVEMAATS
jgi:uncharacterized membrane protein YeaQ/YmgE (transglycosylase-associated protein family)